jgi:hypothetical protein
MSIQQHIHGELVEHLTSLVQLPIRRTPARMKTRSAQLGSSMMSLQMSLVKAA